MKIRREYFISFNYVLKDKSGYGYGNGHYYSNGSIDCHKVQQELDKLSENKTHAILYYKFNGWKIIG